MVRWFVLKAFDHRPYKAGNIRKASPEPTSPSPIALHPKGGRGATGKPPERGESPADRSSQCFGRCTSFFNSPSPLALRIAQPPGRVNKAGAMHIAPGVGEGGAGALPLPNLPFSTRLRACFLLPGLQKRSSGQGKCKMFVNDHRFSRICCTFRCNKPPRFAY